ncbi:hypothetical protein BX600DRAFT_435473 [Xylariales sp. PMI_506]|nr:hypothetical protein BX600DRAFT_435473 [Xylariales sp. PMI_506]
MVIVNNEFVSDLDQWTRSYHPSDVKLCYERAQDILIKRPTKRFELSFGPTHAKKELLILKDIAMAQVLSPPEAWVCRLHGIVRDGNKLFGMLFLWIDTKGVLSGTRAAQSSAQLRRRWAAQINGSLEKLHQKGIIWGDAKAENIFIDRDDNAWVTD